MVVCCVGVLLYTSFAVHLNTYLSAYPPIYPGAVRPLYGVR